MSKLNVSDATISRDQATFFGMLPDDGSVRLEGGKLEVGEHAFVSLPEGILEPSLDEWLRVMLGSKYIEMTAPERVQPSRDTIGAMFRSIESKRAVFIHYVSRSGSESTWRPVSPHALVDVAGRYHARCFDHLRGRYGDFVLTRILGTTFDRNDAPSYVDARFDKDWSHTVDVKVMLKEDEPHLVGRLDYGLDETGSRIFRVRKALMPYLIDQRHQGFDSPVTIEEM
ncbi:WYL domain-containing protein [Phaeovulum sp. NW3]|uniref:WYL domain-containing protein n=1 Tax=Phaeovulum sp. NW3 TaxID=2934933 RepID=UPI0020217027|nr:WYL domain-containing protein [Phaeovulum sp. NW3]MCL7466258.1 WYL domain-containing protein [Phaeovulum sp. NW3]